MPHFANDAALGRGDSGVPDRAAVNEEGCGTTIWETSSRTARVIENDENGRVACEHRHHWREDIALTAGGQWPRHGNSRSQADKC